MGAAAGVAQEGLSIAGGYIRGRGEKVQADFQAGISRYNANLSRLSAKDARIRGDIAASSQRMRGNQIKGQQIAQFGAGNVDVGSSGAASAVADTTMMSELDAQTIKSNAAREAWGYETKASQYDLQADFQKQGGEAAQTSDIVGGYLGGIGNLSTSFVVGKK